MNDDLFELRFELRDRGLQNVTSIRTRLSFESLNNFKILTFMKGNFAMLSFRVDRMVKKH